MHLPASCLLLLVALAAAPARGESSPPVRLELAEIGFRGVYKLGHWVPVRVEIAAGDQPIRGRLELETLDGDGVATRFTRDAIIEVDANQVVAVWRYVRLGRRQAGLRLRWSGEGQVSETWIATRDMPAAAEPATQPLVVTAGAPIGVDDALRLRRRNLPELTSVVLEDPSQLPDQWYGYESVDLLVLPTGELAWLQRLSAEQQQAMIQWVKLGGTLLLSVGRHGPELLGDEGPLAELAPGRLLTRVEQQRSSALEVHAEATQPIDQAAPGGTAQPLPVTVLDEPRGRVELWEHGTGSRRPLVIHATLGMGRVTFVAVDLDQAPLAAWPGRPNLVAKLLQQVFEAPGDEQSGVAGRIAHVGYDDLTGQLRSALDQFASVQLVSFSLVATLVVVYVLLIGPADYFLLRSARRTHWAWVSFPLLVVLFAGFAWWLTARTKGQRTWVHQMEVVDIDPGQGMVRGTMWANLYSPRSELYSLELVPAAASAGSLSAGPSDVLLAWQGLPGRGLGGMSSTAGTAAWPRSYEIMEGPAGQGGRIANLPVQVSSTKSLTGRWSAPLAAPLHPSQLAAEPNGLLFGALQNPLDIDLVDCRLYHQNWAYLFQDDFRAGQSVSVDLLQRRILDWHLTGRRMEYRTEWDTRNLDVPRLAEVLMFHRAAGGQNYTKLSHRYQGYLDLSDHLTSGYAVLVGRSREPASRLEAQFPAGPDGSADSPRPLDAENHWTFYRVLIPVSTASVSP